MNKEEQYIEQLRAMRYPGTIDVVDAVMDQVSQMPLLAPKPSRAKTWLRVSSIVAAAAVTLVLVNVVLIFTRSYDEPQIDKMIAEVYDYHASYAGSYDGYSELGAVELFIEE